MLPGSVKLRADLRRSRISTEHVVQPDVERPELAAVIAGRDQDKRIPGAAWPRAGRRPWLARRPRASGRR